MADTLIAGGRTFQSDWDGALTDLEARAELDSLEGLQSERRQLIEHNAGLMARFGNFGMHDDFRKRFLEAQKVRARMILNQTEGKRPTEAQIEAEAYGSPEYQAFLDTALAEKVAYLKIQSRIDEINERIRARDLSILAYNAEMKLAR